MGRSSALNPVQKTLLVLTAASLGVALGSCETAGKKPQEQATDNERLAVIDAHTHTRFDGRLERTSKIKVTEEQYFREWKQAGVVGAISHV